MSDSPAPQPQIQSKPGRNVTPGCLLLIFAGLWLLMLGGYCVWAMYRQLKEIRTFADSSPKHVSPAQPAADQITALRNRIKEFGAVIHRKEKASLRLTVDDLNVLLSAEEDLRSMRENAKVESIGDTVKVQVSVAMNGVPLTGERLYINGIADITPVTNKDKGLGIRTVNLTVPGKTVAEGFLNHYKQDGHLDTLLLNPARESKDTSIPDTLKKINAARLEPGAVVLEYTP